MIRKHLADINAMPVGSPSPALEEVIFYWIDSAPLVEKHGEELLTPEWRKFLTRELSRRGARVSIRIRRENGEIALQMDQTAKFGGKIHIEELEVSGIQKPKFSGTLQRVGLEHLWMRF